MTAETGERRPGGTPTAAWRWIDAGATGTSHAGASQGCQDRHAVEGVGTHGMEALVAVVCDGAGGVAHGEVGATLACAAFAAQAKAFLEDGGDARDGARIAAIVRAVADRIKTAAAHAGVAAQDFATTLVACVADGRGATVVHVGDGACALRVVEAEGGLGEWRVANWPSAGEYAGTTDFLTDAETALAVVTIDAPVGEVALFSDGLERLALDFRTKAAHAPFLDPMMRPLRAARGGGRDEGLAQALAGFLDSAKVNERTDDDKTLILACRVGTGAP